jgi:nitric oxide reductase subunit B
MVVLNLFPGGVMQLADVLENGYWHARSVEFLTQTKIQLIEWIRLPADLIFIVFGVLPIVIASVKTYALIKNKA